MLIELRAVFLVLQHFKPLLQSRYALVRSNNIGFHQKALLKLLEDLWFWALVNLLCLKAIPSQTSGGSIPRWWGGFGHGSGRRRWICSPPVATPTAHYGSLWHLRTIHPDGFAYAPWPRQLLFTFYPLQLIPFLLERVKLEGCWSFWWLQIGDRCPFCGRNKALFSFLHFCLIIPFFVSLSISFFLTLPTPHFPQPTVAGEIQ